MSRILLSLTIVFSAFTVALSQEAPRLPILNNFGPTPFVDGKTIVEEVVFEGIPFFPDTSLQPITETEILDVLGEGRTKIAVGKPFSGGGVARAVTLIREFLNNEGFIEAQPRAFGQAMSESGMRLIFDLNAGDRSRVVGIEFIDSGSIPNSILVEKLKTCVGNDWQIFKARKYSYFTVKCVLPMYWSQGYVDARIGGFRAETVNSGISVAAKVEEGPRYRVRGLQIAGSTVFTHSEIQEIIGLKTGDVLDAIRLQSAVWVALKRKYLDFGYVLYDADFTVSTVAPLAKDTDGVADIKIEIEEGRKFTVRSLDFKGIGFSYDRRFDDRFPLRAGDTFNQSELERGLGLVRSEPEFCEPDADQDVELRFDEEGPLVDIVIRLRRCR